MEDNQYRRVFLSLQGLLFMVFQVYLRVLPPNIVVIEITIEIGSY